jgi:hypothetical protein
MLGLAVGLVIGQICRRRDRKKYHQRINCIIKKYSPKKEIQLM